MKLQETRRKQLVWSMLVLTLDITIWSAGSGHQDDELVSITPRRSLQAARVAAAVPQSDNKAFRSRPPITTAPGNLFEVSRSQAQADEAALQGPVMPAVPFRYAGRMIEDGDTVLFLERGHDNLAVKVGDIVGDQWRIQSIERKHIVLAYMPLQTTVTLPTGETD